MINWHWKTFGELNTNELYDLLQLREAVFQIEQQSLYIDCDGIDQISEHLLGYKNNQLTAYLRTYKKENTIPLVPQDARF